MNTSPNQPLDSSGSGVCVFAVGFLCAHIFLAGESAFSFGINDDMSRFVSIGVLAVLLGIAAFALHGCGEFRGERIQIRKRFDAMTQARLGYSGIRRIGGREISIQQPKGAIP